MKISPIAKNLSERPVPQKKKKNGAKAMNIGHQMMTSFFKTAFLTMLLLFSLRVEASFEFESIEIEDFEFIQQGQNECVPASFLKMFKYGNATLRSVYDGIPGDNDLEKLQDLIGFALEPGELAEGPLYNPETGVNRVNFQRLIDAYSMAVVGEPSPYTAALAHRQETETQPGQFLRRIHETILNSLAHQAPVMAGLELSTTDHQAQDFIYELAHAIVILGVQKKLSD